MPGYLDRGFAESFSSVGQPRLLPGCGGWIIERPIGGSAWADAMGCYPLFLCKDWTRLEEDLRELTGRLVSLTAVTDPFCPLSQPELQSVFTVVRPMSPHHVLDLDRSWEDRASRHHRQTVRAAIRSGVRVDLVPSPDDFLDAWLGLYDHLANKHQIRGFRLFDPLAFRRQLNVPGAVVFAARLQDELIGADWYFHDGDRVYGHLAAFSPKGYATSASYALQAAAIDYFRDRAAVMDIGGIPAVARVDASGLAAFKAGWGGRTLPTFLCGKVLSAQAYGMLTEAAGGNESAYFPGYRRGEFL